MSDIYTYNEILETRFKRKNNQKNKSIGNFSGVIDDGNHIKTATTTFDTFMSVSQQRGNAGKKSNQQINTDYNHQPIQELTKEPVKKEMYNHNIEDIKTNGKRFPI